jgi:hypothetical protein
MLLNRTIRVGFLALTAGVLCQSAVLADAMRLGQFNGNTLPGNDDGSTGQVSVGFNLNYFGQNYSQLYVNNNGNVTFTGPLATFTPFGLTSSFTPIIAPFFADVDTRNQNSAVVTFGTGTVDGHNAFGVNWDGVGYYNQETDRVNRFQMVLIDRSDTGAGNFDIEFNYDQIQWETGNASGGHNGWGGDSAHVGWSNGSGSPGTFFELAGSGVNGAFLDIGPSNTTLIGNSLNSNVDGRYVFHARNGQVGIDPPIVLDDPVPEPMSFILFGTLLGGGAWWLRRR